MKQATAHAELVARRGELMAELFLQDLEPASLARPPANFGYDFLVVFPRRNGGTNTFAVEVKATEHPDPSSFVIDKQTYNRLAHSNIPGLLLVADSKENRLFFAWPPRVDTRSQPGSVSIQLTPVDDKTEKELHKRLVA